MRVAFIRSPQGETTYSVPVGLLSLASYAKRCGYQPVIHDFHLLFKGLKYHPSFFKRAAKQILSHHPQVLGFTVMCNTLPATLLIAKECKALAPHLPVIFGGPEVSFEEIEVLKEFQQVDIIVRGEGELTLVEVLRALKMRSPLSGILGITYRKNGQIIRNPDRPFIANLDELPFLDFSLLPHLKRYKAGQIEAGRGCPFQCTFCSTCKMWKRSFRIKSPQRLATELRQTYFLFKKFNQKEKSLVSLIHDNLLISRKTTNEFLSLIAYKKLAWACSTRLEALDEDLIKKLSAAGCREIFLGIESASPKIQKEIKKNLPLAKLPQILKMLCQNDIHAILSFIVGFPNETKFQINQTLLTALKAKLFSPLPEILFSPLTPLKGSEMYLEAKRKFTPEFCQTDVSPPVTNLAAELSLIKKYPQLFPSFHFIKNNSSSIAPSTLQKISPLFCFLSYFPLTTLLLLKYFLVTPLGLAQKIISAFEAAGITWRHFPDQESLFFYYLLSFRDFICQNSDLLIKETFKHEEFFQRSNFAENNPFRPIVKINFRSRLRIAQNVMIKVYSYDIFGLIDKLKINSRKKMPKTKAYIAYVPGKDAKAVSLSSLSYHLLLFCHGRKSIQEIICQSLDREDQTPEAKSAILERFEFLQEQGIVSVT